MNHKDISLITLIDPLAPPSPPPSLHGSPQLPETEILMDDYAEVMDISDDFIPVSNPRTTQVVPPTSKPEKGMGRLLSS
jgi:hypothetical protein